MEPTESTLFVKSVEKAFAVLRAFTRENHSMTLAEIASEAALDKSSAQRFVHTLHALGYLAKEQNGRSYQLSPRLLEFGFAYQDMDPVVLNAQDHLKDLHEKIGESVSLAKLDKDDIILVARWASRNIIAVNVRVGSRLPAVYMASGRVLIASLPESEQEAILTRAQLRQHTPQSIVAVDLLRDELRRVGAQGFCVTRSQYFQGDLSIAAPILDKHGSVVASVSVNTIEMNGPDSKREQVLLDQVLGAAKKSSFLA